MMKIEEEDFSVEEKACIAGQPCVDVDKCGSSDAMAIYIPSEGEPNAHCFSCNGTFSAKDLEHLDIDTEEGLETYLKRTRSVKKNAGTPITKEQIDAITKRTTWNGYNFRGIKDETLKFYKVKTEHCQDGTAFKRYYPNTIDYKPSSYQVRVVKEKIFFFIGKAGNDTQFFGQSRFKKGGGRLLIVGGQEDCMAASQMLWDYAGKRGNQGYGRMAVVSTPSGERCSAIIKKQYAWLDSFDEIYIGLDSDEKGIEAMEEALPHLPKGKVKVCTWSAKDPNDMLEKGMDKKFIDDFYRAKKHVPIGICDTSGMHDQIVQNLMLPKLTLPEFMVAMQDLMAGGIPFKKIINIAAETGIGKTSLVNEIIYHWIFLPQCKVGVVTLELDTAEYGIAMLSRHVGKKLSLFDSPDKAVKFMERADIKKKEDELFFTEDNDPRFYLVDDRSTTVESIIEKVEELIISFGCNVIVFDPISDLIARKKNEEQEEFMAWQKNMKKQHDVIFLNVNHVRGSSTQQDKGKDKVRFLTEDDMMGSTSIPKSADCNILLSRNKYAEDPILKNTTQVWMPKCRWTGHTGDSGQWVYDNDSHKLFDSDDYHRNFLKNGVKEA